MKKKIHKIITKISTIQEMFFWTVNQFNSAHIYYGHGTDNSWDEALQLILPSLFLPLNFPINKYNLILTFRERIILVNLVLRRIKKRIPVPYLTHKSWFCGLEFYVDKRVLIPRSPISELINNRFKNILSFSPTRILDMCTGNGCIAIACAYTYLKTHIDAVDISPSVLKVTKKNIQLHKVKNRVNVICSDLFCNVPPIHYDLIITNPPYVNKNDINSMPKEFHAEPKLGLIAGNDGLKFVKRILACAFKYLSEEGILICEVGNSMKQLIKKYPQIPFKWLKLNHGGIGIFMLTWKQLIRYKNFF
ncbi:50S ribosomal protein L3 glutamine methyltransferase [Candidatus Mikella endobia]|uniref:50S ribosomal protein L3 glutamine methyltransferase n=2 Tax=Candidatus Mikella endobia TaxID=1778264 RepID=A0A143WQ09_9ENTR|nr:50S ribosomal protein L3 glutamine methyltransferase [Candidatus Mikella endobia]